MKHYPLISVIIPVYNNEKYIRGCLRSLLNQSYRQLEIIVVNDGSTDKTGQILDSEFADKDNITVLHKQNGGVSAARNDGIAAAHGELIAFLDSDDEYLPDAFEKMVPLMDDSVDFLLCSPIKIWIQEHSEPFKNAVVSRDEFTKDFIEQNLKVNFIWANLYRASIIHKNDIRFNEQVRFAEDYEFNLHYIKAITGGIRFSDTAVYRYYICRSGVHEKKDHPARDIAVVLDYFGGKEHTPQDIYRHTVDHYLKQCITRNLWWHPPKKAAILIKEAYRDALAFADDDLLRSIFTQAQYEAVRRNDYDALVRDRLQSDKKLNYRKLRYRLSRTAAVTMNTLRGIKK